MAGKTHCQTQSRPAFGYFRPSAHGSSTQPRLSEVAIVLSLDELETAHQLGDHHHRKRRRPVPVALPGADDELTAPEVHVLDAELRALEKPEARAIEKDGHQAGSA